jgi:hypothetical protein
MFPPKPLLTHTRAPVLAMERTAESYLNWKRTSGAERSGLALVLMLMGDCAVPSRHMAPHMRGPSYAPYDHSPACAAPEHGRTMNHGAVSHLPEWHLELRVI